MEKHRSHECVQVSSIEDICWDHCEVFDEGSGEEIHCSVGQEGCVEDWNEHYYVDYD